MLRERAVRMVAEIRADHESEWAAMSKVAELLGAGTPETVRKWCRLAEVDGASAWTNETVAQLATQAETMARWPNGFGHLLGVTELALFGAVAVAIVGEWESAEFQALIGEVTGEYLPTLVLVTGRPGEDSVPLLRDRPAIGGRATAYVCRGFVCDVPTTDPAELKRQLRALGPKR